MKAPTSIVRFNNATNLLNYGFANYEFVSLAKKGDIVRSIKIDKGISSNVNAIFESDVGAIVFKGNDININKVINLPNSISAPIKQGDKIGNVSFNLNNEIIATADLLSDSDINKIDIFSMSGYIINNWFNMCR